MKKTKLILTLLALAVLFLQLNARPGQVPPEGNTKKSESSGPENGTLLIIGGAASNTFYVKFMELAGGPDAPVVVIPTALSSDELTEKDLARFKKSFTDRGFKNVIVLHTRDRDEANNPEFYEPLVRARGDTGANTIMMGDHEQGLGFITNVAIDQHLFARNRQFDMFEILENRPELLGIGLDENTGIIVKGERYDIKKRKVLR